MSRTRSVRVLGRDFDTDAFTPLPDRSQAARADLAKTGQGRFEDSRRTADSQVNLFDKEWWSPETVLWILVIPLVVFLFLITIRPDYLKCDEEIDSLDYMKVLLWTLVISLIIWVVLIVLRNKH